MPGRERAPRNHTRRAEPRAPTGVKRRSVGRRHRGSCPAASPAVRRAPSLVVLGADCPLSSERLGSPAPFPFADAEFRLAHPTGRGRFFFFFFFFLRFRPWIPDAQGQNLHKTPATKPGVRRSPHPPAVGPTGTPPRAPCTAVGWGCGPCLAVRRPPLSGPSQFSVCGTHVRSTFLN